MDQHHIPAVTHLLGNVPSRRDVFRGIAGIGLAPTAVLTQSPVRIKAKRKHKRKDRRKHHSEKDRKLPCAEACPSTVAFCLDRPEGHPLCAQSALTGNCVNCATDQDCLATPETPYCITAATERETGEPFPLAGFCPELTIGVCIGIGTIDT
jgi:hypothetical protein